MSPADLHKEVERLISAYVDNELTQSEAQRVRIHIEDCGECAHAFRELSQLRALTASVAFPEPVDERLDRLKLVLSVRAPRQTGWLLICVGLILWAAYLAFIGVSRMRMPQPAEAVFAAVVAGFGLLFLSVIRQRVLEHRHDPYRRVRR